MKTTIYALATSPLLPRSGSGVAVVRVSGPASGASVRLISGDACPAERMAALRTFRHPDTADVIDRGLVLWFAGPRSVTGEDYAEFHIHGGRAVIAAMLAACGAVDGCRLAEPGEFARRSFLNGKLDLTAVEGIADLVAAETAAQRRQALRQLDGELGRLYDGWRHRLLHALARIEADIDFPEEDLPADLAIAELRELGAISEEMARHLGDRRGERLRDGICIAIVGRPNVGKSSLLNRLARREAAIVSSVPGTTRDIVEVHLDIGGYPVVLIDTAGLRESDDPVEREGIRRARTRAANADLRLLVAAIDDGLAMPDFGAGDGEDFGRDIVVANKADLIPSGQNADELLLTGETICVSAETGMGIDRLVGEIEDRIDELMGRSASVELELPPLTRHRHREALMECVDGLRRGIHAARSGSQAVELLAEDVRLAVRALGRITGRVDVEDILDVVFREFCIGK